MKALHELQGRLIAGLDPRNGERGYGPGKIHANVLFPELFRQLQTAAEGMLSVAKSERIVFEKHAPEVADDAADPLKREHDGSP